MSTGAALGPLNVWDDETGERYYIAGHVNRRRSLAAVSAYVREACGREDRNDQLRDVRATDVLVAYRWMRPDPQKITNPDTGKVWVDDEPGAWCEHDHPQAVAVTVVGV